MYTLTIDDDIPLAEFTPTFESLEARVAAALSSLHDTNSMPFEISEEDAALSRAIFAGRQTATDADLSKPEVITHLGALLQEYDHLVVKSAAQLRTYITNKLILESANADPRIRLKSLEMLGKISDVGLFTDKTEITMRHRPTEELEQLLRERLTRVVEGEAFEVNKPQQAVNIEFDIAEVTGAHT
jgi:hypothetical protein